MGIKDCVALHRNLSYSWRILVGVWHASLVRRWTILLTRASGPAHTRHWCAPWASQCSSRLRTATLLTVTINKRRNLHFRYGDMPDAGAIYPLKIVSEKEFDRIPKWRIAERNLEIIGC